MAKSRRQNNSAVRKGNTSSSNSSGARSKEAKRGRKLETIEAVQKALKTYPHLYLYQLVNPRNAFFQRLRRDLSDSTVFWLGKNRVLQRALGKDSASAFVPCAEMVAKRVTGATGIMLSRLLRVELEDALAGYSLIDYARAGSVAPRKIAIRPGSDGGQLCRADNGEPVPATAEPGLRAAGMPTMLRGGSILLATGDEYVVCEAGDKLTDHQARILKLFGIQLDEFSVRLLGHLDIATGKLTEL